ncbi:right-handed parallel beta-helix repeat-containing protein [Kitasatospora sp. NPDC004531]
MSVLAGAALAGSAVWMVVPPASAATVDIRTVCTASTTSGSTITLTGDCVTTDNLTVPDGFTLDGAGHTITANDTSLANPLLGAVVSNAGATMDVKNLTVQGSYLPRAPGDATTNAAYFGIRFLSASGSVSNVTVTGITRHQTYNFGQGIMVDATSGGPQTVTVTGVRVTDFQKNGLTANGSATMNVTGSTLGPPDMTVPLPAPPVTGNIAQNSVQYFNSGGTFTGNTVVTYTADNSTSSSTGMLLFTANNLTVDHNTITGPNGADIGINVTGGTNIVISYNDLSRSPVQPPLRDFWGFGMAGYSGAAATTTLICNTFSGWNENLFGGLTQPPCIITEHLRDGTVGVPYTDVIEAVTENPNPQLTWTVAAGDFPPGLTLNPDGTITGTPTAAGSYTFTAQVSDPVDGTATREYTIVVEAPAPGLSLAKTATATDADGQPIDALAAAGDVVTYGFDVVNTGNVPLAALAIDDSGFSGSGTLGPVTCAPVALGGTLVGGASTHCTATYRVTEADIAGGGTLRNTATASGLLPDGATLTSGPAGTSLPIAQLAPPPTPTPTPTPEPTHGPGHHPEEGPVVHTGGSPVEPVATAPTWPITGAALLTAAGLAAFVLLRRSGRS